MWNVHGAVAHCASTSSFGLIFAHDVSYNALCTHADKEIALSVHDITTSTMAYPTTVQQGFSVINDNVSIDNMMVSNPDNQQTVSTNSGSSSSGDRVSGSDDGLVSAHLLSNSYQCQYAPVVTSAQLPGVKGVEPPLSRVLSDLHAAPLEILPFTSPQAYGKIQGNQTVFVPNLGGNQTAMIESQSDGTATFSGPLKPRVRARRGQATDPHSIAERHRRERIAERMKALQELVPNANKTDKASMLDEIIDYVKFLQLQVKVLSMSRLGGAGAVTVAEDAQNSFVTSHSFQDGIMIAERQVAKLMENDMGSAMQFLQEKGLCLVPLSLTTIMPS